MLQMGENCPLREAGKQTMFPLLKKKKKNFMVAMGCIWQNAQERDELRKEFISLQP